MDVEAQYRRWRSLERARGNEARLLTLGDWRVRIAGLDAELARDLDRRWGGFLGPDGGPAPTQELRLLDAGDEDWLQQLEPGEGYRIESAEVDGGPLIRSYSFAARPDAGGTRRWTAAISRSADEPLQRALDNLVRYLAARTAVAAGGFALHGAGVLRDGRAYLFCGKSGSGKSTVVRLSRPHVSLGDDFAIAIPRDGVWSAAAVPFDNSERAPARPPAGWLPLAGVWRLYQAARTRIERPPATLASASLLACVAFPWAMPDLAERLLFQVEGFVGAGRFAHLRFTESPDFWTAIDAAAGGD